MDLPLLDSRVHLIVTLRRAGVADDAIAAITTLYDAVGTRGQSLILQLMTLETPEVVRALADIVPDAIAAVMKPGAARTADQIVEDAAKPFLS